MTQETIRLFVRDVAQSAVFYSRVLGQATVAAYADHAIFENMNLRLELRRLPASIIVNRQIDIVLRDADTVVQTYESLWDACVRLPQIPTDVGFGVGFVALDPDGHRLRVFCLNQAAAA